MASDDDFFVIRRFGKISARVILLMQQRITQLEEDLSKEYLQCRDEGGDNGTFESDYRWRRVQIMDELAWRLERYRESRSMGLSLGHQLIITNRTVRFGSFGAQSEKECNGPSNNKRQKFLRKQQLSITTSRNDLHRKGG